MFSSSAPKSTGEEKTKPDEHMVLRAVMDGREWSAIQKQRGSRDHDDKAAGFSFTVCFPPDAA